MSSDLTRVMILGRVAKDPPPEVATDANGKPAVTIPVSVSRNSTDPNTGEKVKRHPLYLSCTAFDNNAKLLVKNAREGQLIWIEGRLTPDEKGNPRSWVKKNGEITARYEITVDQFRLVVPRDGSPSDWQTPEDEE